MQSYDNVAAHMGCCQGLLIFRRFPILHSRNLLLYQAEIMEKQAQLITAIQIDRESNNAERMSFASDFRAMMQSQLVFEEPSLSQKKIALELRTLLKEHGEALLLVKKLAELPPVDPTDLETLKDVLRGREDEAFLKGSEGFTWETSNKLDLTSLLTRRQEMDSVSNWLSWFRTEIFHKYWGYRSSSKVQIPSDWAPDYSPSIRSYSEQTSSRFVNILRVVIGPTLTTTSALCLFFIDDSIKQMGVVVLSSFLFSTMLALITVPARTETVVATATFTAVLVVFVGSNAQSSLCQC